MRGGKTGEKEKQNGVSTMKAELETLGWRGILLPGAMVKSQPFAAPGAMCESVALQQCGVEVCVHVCGPSYQQGPCGRLSLDGPATWAHADVQGPHRAGPIP